MFSQCREEKSDERRILNASRQVLSMGAVSGLLMAEYAGCTTITPGKACVAMATDMGVGMAINYQREIQRIEEEADEIEL